MNSQAAVTDELAQRGGAEGVPAGIVSSTPWRRFLRNRLAMFGLVVLVLMTLLCVATLPWTITEFNDQNLTEVRRPPQWSVRYLFGTDGLGRSLLARTLYGGVISLMFGLLAAAISVVIGVGWGMISGYLGGRIDGVMMRIVDVLYSLPYILLVMLFSLTFTPYFERFLSPEWAAYVVLMLAIGGVSWLTMARVIRGQVLSLKEQPFVEAARASGAGTGTILWRHILPNLVGPIMVYATLIVPQAILQESFLSFLGIGTRDPQATWGKLAAEGVELLSPIAFQWWMLLFPCLALVLTLLSLNFVGDGLRDAFDPRLKR